MSTSKGLVLITGVNGYIAAQTAAHFLSHGYGVRGTVRKLASAKPIIEGPLKYYAEAGKFEVIEVPDITVDGAFDKAVKGVTAIAHLASPVTFQAKDPAPMLKASVNGTKTVLESALTHAGPQLKTVVVMSSITAIVNFSPTPYILTEKDWNNVSEKEVERLGIETPGPVIYFASKAASEKAFWAFRDEKKPSFSMSAVDPVYVMGPPLVPPKTADDITGTYRNIWTVFSGAPHPDPLPFIPNIVDVRDVAQLVRYSVEHPDETNNERYIASGPVAHPQAIADVLRTAFPDARNRIVEGTPGKGYDAEYTKFDVPLGTLSVDSSKGRKLLEGGQWTPFSKTVVDTAKQFLHLV